MSNELSILQRATQADVLSEPFPHIVLRDALPHHLYQKLADQFPSNKALEIEPSKNNVRWDYEAHRVRTNDGISPLWREFIAYHVSQAFFDEVATLFGDDIVRLYPGRFPTKESINLKAGTRFSDKYGAHDILMDAMISGNTPVITASTVRSSHIDNGDKLFSGLFYMKPDSYDAQGGDLTISRFNPEYVSLMDKAALFNDAYVDDDHLTCVKTIKYDRNLAVLFINSIESIHGVTVRKPTEKSRIFVNLVGEIERRLYLKGRKIRPRYVEEGENDGKNHSKWLRKLADIFPRRS